MVNDSILFILFKYNEGRTSAIPFLFHFLSLTFFLYAKEIDRKNVDGDMISSIMNLPVNSHESHVVFLYIHDSQCTLITKLCKDDVQIKMKNQLS